MNTTISKDLIINRLTSTNVMKIPTWESLNAIGDNSSFEGDIILDASTGFFVIMMV